MKLHPTPGYCRDLGLEPTLACRRDLKLDPTPACCRDPRLEEAQRTHTQELANVTRLMQHKIDAVKKDCWEKQLKINKLDVRTGGCG